jgi:hypothetical protein
VALTIAALPAVAMAVAPIAGNGNSVGANTAHDRNKLGRVVAAVVAMPIAMAITMLVVVAVAAKAV